MKKREKEYLQFKKIGVRLYKYGGFIYNGKRQGGRYMSKADKKKWLDATIKSMKNPHEICMDLSRITRIFP